MDFILVMAVGFGTAGCATPRAMAPQSPRAAAPLTQLTQPLIEAVGVEPKTIDVRRGEQAQIRYALSTAAEVAIDMVDEEGHVIRHLAVGQQGAGPQTIVWDGRSDDGVPVSAGVYRYIILATHSPFNRQSTRYDPSTDEGGEELQVRDFTFDPASGAFRWVMPKTGFARLRIGLKGFPHLRTLLDWEPMEGGAHELTWDGRDSSGLIQFKDHPNLTMNLSAFAMPSNTIIVHSGLQSSIVNRQSTMPTYPPLTKGESAYFHARHPRAICHEARLDIEFPGASQTGEGLPLLRGTVPVRVTINPADAARLINSRFEVALYEDTTFLFEEEESSNPYT